MMKAKIYQPSKTAMQSGRRNTQLWILQFEQEKPKQIDSLMGWTGSGDMRGQIKLEFTTKGEAVDYAERNKILYEVQERLYRRIVPKSYSDNFKFDKID